MKYFIGLIITLSFMGCDGINYVTNKYYAGYDSWSGNRVITLPVGICEFSSSQQGTFQDSCNKYNVGDKLPK